MNTALSLIAGTSVLALTALSAFADGTPNTCSLETLHGTLAWGGAATNRYRGPNSSSGMESYDGKGHMKYYELSSDGISKEAYNGTGTYTITSNCIATVIYDGDTADPWIYFVAPDGSAYFYNNNEGYGQVGGGRVERISRALLVE
jgi:hypothetical protein